MLSPPPRPSTETGPPGQGPPTRSVPTSIASELLRGLGLHSVHVQTSTSIESSVSTLCLRTRVTKRPQPRSAGLALTDTLLPPRTAGVREPPPPRGPSACGCDVPSGGGRVGPRDTGVAAGAAGRADPEVWGVPPSSFRRRLSLAASVHYGTAPEVRAPQAKTLEAADAANPARFRHRRPNRRRFPPSPGSTNQPAQRRLWGRRRKGVSLLA